MSKFEKVRNHISTNMLSDDSIQNAKDKMVEEKTFTNREEYLAWVAKWKSDYKALSTKIRETKNMRTSTDSKSYELDRMAYEANQMLMRRILGKEIAGEQRKETLEAA